MQGGVEKNTPAPVMDCVRAQMATHFQGTGNRYRTLPVRLPSTLQKVKKVANVSHSAWNQQLSGQGGRELPGELLGDCSS